MTESTKHRRIVHALAVLTAVVSLAPIGFGSLVTTLGAGMAFPDWPTSDGQGMLAYPWLQSTGDKFVEHGHRLAGMLVGLCAIALVVASWILPMSRTTRTSCLLVLGGVIIQGLIGGARVLLDRTTIALGHSIFGCAVFVLLWIVARHTSAGSQRIEARLPRSSMRYGLAIVVPMVCGLQYMLGAFVRHLGTMIDAHLAGACLVVALTVVVVGLSIKTPSASLRRGAVWLGAAVLAQITIGLCVWVTKYGFPPAGLVAVQHSLLQVVSRSVHTVIGMAVVATAVSWSVSVWRTRQAVCPSLAPGMQAAHV